MNNDETFETICDKHKELCSNSKVLFEPGIMNSGTNLKHIDFNPDMYAQAHSTSPVRAKQEFVCSTLYPELKLRKFEDRDILLLSFEQQRSKLRKILID